VAHPPSLGTTDTIINTMNDTTDAKIVDLFTDGACKGNPGLGGWGALLRYGGVEKT
jgi:hypothetical protein